MIFPLIAKSYFFSLDYREMVFRMNASYPESLAVWIFPFLNGPFDKPQPRRH